MVAITKYLHPLAECKRLNWPFWQCPPFLFIILGFLTIISMAATYVFASRLVDEPEIAAMIVILVAVFFLVVGNFIINGFNRIAEANLMQSEFISIFSHQLRSPLSVSKWTLEVMEKEVQAGNLQQTANYLSTFRDSTETIVRLVNTLLEVSRIEAGTLVLNKTKVSLVGLTKNVLGDMRNYVEASNIKLGFESEPDLPEVWADRDRLLIVIHNLVDNAVRYSEGGKAVKVSIKRQDSSLVWEIQDQGIGIPDFQQKFLFHKFFRAANSSRFQTEGSGVGLYIVKNIIGVLGGRVGFKSVENKGSIFWFTIPLERKA